MQGWIIKTDAALSANNLVRLFANEISTVRIRGFATAPECRSFALAMRNAKFGDYGHGRPVHFIGTTQFNFRFRNKADYFASVPAAYAAQRDIFSKSFDPLARLLELLRQTHAGPVDVATEPDGTRYFAGILRKTVTGGSLHADYAPYTAPGYAIGRINAQITWNLYVEALDHGGETTLYDRCWTPRRRDAEVSDNYGLDQALIADARAHVFAPTVGDVVMFNTLNMHQVGGAEGSTGLRLQIGSFVGRMPSGALVLWS